MYRKNTREKLLEAAVDLFSVKGFDGTTVDEIAGTIGIKGPTIYKYFKGKEALLVGIAEKADAEYESGKLMKIRSSSAIDSGEALKAYTMNHIMFTMENEHIKKIRRLFTIEQFKDERFARTATLHQITNIETLYSGIFKDMMKRGLMNDGDNDMLAFQYTSPITILLQWCDREPAIKEQIVAKIEKHIDLFIKEHCP